MYPKPTNKRKIKPKQAKQVKKEIEDDMSIEVEDEEQENQNFKPKRAKRKEKQEENKEINIAEAKNNQKVGDDRLKQMYDEGELVQLTVEKLKNLWLERNIELKRASKKILISSLETYIENMG